MSEKVYVVKNFDTLELLQAIEGAAPGTFIRVPKGFDPTTFIPDSTGQPTERRSTAMNKTEPVKGLMNQLLNLEPGRFEYLPSEDVLMRKFETGATRDLSEHKLDYEGFLSPIVLKRFAEYMHEHRKQKDGSVRSSDNWQKGIPKQEYMKSLCRHEMEVWLMMRGVENVKDAEGNVISLEEALCALLFNVQGLLFEVLRDKERREVKTCSECSAVPGSFH